MIALNIIQQVEKSNCSNERLTGLANNDLSEEETDDYSQFHCDDDVFSSCPIRRRRSVPDSYTS